jgi:cytidylate kinase
MATGIHRIIDHQMRKWEFEASARRESPRELSPGEPRELPANAPVVHPCITIARQIGAGGGEIAREIASVLGQPLCDREILDTIAGEGRIRSQILELLDEGDRSALQIWIEGILRGRLADKDDYLRALAHAVGSVAAHGPAVFVGRGVNFILGPGRGLHLRVVAPVERRVETLCASRGLAEVEARALIERTDADRAAFVRRHFHREIDDPLAYDLVLNTASTSTALCVKTVLAAWQGVAAGAAKAMGAVERRSAST